MGGAEHRRQHEGIAVQGRHRVVVIELEALDETGVEHCRRGSAGGACAPTDQGRIAGAVEGGHGVNPRSGPGQLRADQGASYPVEDEVLGAFAHRRRNVVERRVGKPRRKAACRTSRIRGLAGALWCDICGVRR